MVNSKKKRTSSRSKNRKNFKMALEKIIASGGNQKYIDIFNLNDAQTISCIPSCTNLIGLMQAVSAESRQSLLGIETKKAINRDSIKKFERRNGISQKRLPIPKMRKSRSSSRRSSISSTMSNNSRIVRKRSSRKKNIKSPFSHPKHH